MVGSYVFFGLVLRWHGVEMNGVLFISFELAGTATEPAWDWLPRQTVQPYVLRSYESEPERSQKNSRHLSIETNVDSSSFSLMLHVSQP